MNFPWKHVLVAWVAFFSLNGGAVAQPYPNRPIRLVVPFPAGGAADLAARTVTQALSTFG